MKSQITLLLITVFSLNCYSQISFEKGYFIDNNDQKVECFIKNNDWDLNPTLFTYTLTELGEQKKLTINSVKEFTINNNAKYIRSTVNIDRSKYKSGELSDQRNPIFKEETLFLKVLVEGKANLYLYKDGIGTSYFYNTDTTEIEQLIYKEYKTGVNKVAVNESFKQQLWIHLQSQCLTQNQINNTRCRRKELVEIFKAYNECNNSEYITYERKQNKNSFNLSLRPGLNTTSLSFINAASSYRNTDFGNETTFRLGIEGEFVLPFNRNKWAIIIEPTYQYFKSEKDHATGDYVTTADYKSVELPVGLRHYFFLNDNSKVFINGSFVLDFSGNSKFLFENAGDLEIKTGMNYALGLGYKFQNRYSAELRYFTNRDLFQNYMNFSSEYKTISVIFGYTLF
ncbi:hypothetical protein [Carboxylicivirga caseinilyticus]|uniref:hypothetical protein n=1 Tax=Carboxylicivirga caseinilyticus TaxID=3417572 RepID=UPI003D3405D6|nr:hypothetical protein [Marinilabiliaceae bacterium A049]